MVEQPECQISIRCGEEMGKKFYFAGDVGWAVGLPSWIEARDVLRSCKGKLEKYVYSFAFGPNGNIELLITEAGKNALLDWGKKQGRVPNNLVFETIETADSLEDYLNDPDDFNDALEDDLDDPA